MKKLFVSYHYTGKQGGIIYQGFGNLILDSDCAPRYQVLLEKYTQWVNKEAKKREGMDTITCVILFFKNVTPIHV